eukprot:TRINITY_DN1876_c0_g1_i2.p1 TRINITY_DN1876_c0_g1~~TRINITY_DN1876_c0_g1_i2.p1  ORF type:complete len:463 (-),score=31.72 TRINITY_DN1876_c0_g1_i2:2457-3731(-)
MEIRKLNRSKNRLVWLVKELEMSRPTFSPDLLESELSNVNIELSSLKGYVPPPMVYVNPPALTPFDDFIYNMKDPLFDETEQVIAKYKELAKNSQQTPPEPPPQVEDKKEETPIERVEEKMEEEKTPASLPKETVKNEYVEFKRKLFTDITPNFAKEKENIANYIGSELNEITSETYKKVQNALVDYLISLRESPKHSLNYALYSLVKQISRRTKLLKNISSLHSTTTTEYKQIIELPSLLIAEVNRLFPNSIELTLSLLEAKCPLLIPLQEETCISPEERVKLGLKQKHKQTAEVVLELIDDAMDPVRAYTSLYCEIIQKSEAHLRIAWILLSKIANFSKIGPVHKVIMTIIMRVLGKDFQRFYNLVYERLVKHIHRNLQADTRDEIELELISEVNSQLTKYMISQWFIRLILKHAHYAANFQ